MESKVNHFKKVNRFRDHNKPKCKPITLYLLFTKIALMDTIQIVQSLRNCIPAPAISINTWKNDDRNSKFYEKFKNNSPQHKIEF